ncbi:hypothetical protein NCS55_00671200 [Fusarium keratoplasticum]|nr:hypothetical protein NCS55_00671200 [Fusarium keratoplasticum]
MISEAAMRRMSLAETSKNDQPDTEEHQPDNMDTESAEHLFEDMDTDENQPDTAEDEAEGYDPDDDGED